MFISLLLSLAVVLEPVTSHAQAACRVDKVAPITSYRTAGQRQLGSIVQERRGDEYLRCAVSEPRATYRDTYAARALTAYTMSAIAAHYANDRTRAERNLGIAWALYRVLVAIPGLQESVKDELYSDHALLLDASRGSWPIM